MDDLERMIQSFKPDGLILETLEELILLLRGLGREVDGLIHVPRLLLDHLPGKTAPLKSLRALVCEYFLSP